jgi:hypothetical protein
MKRAVAPTTRIRPFLITVVEIIIPALSNDRKHQSEEIM